MSTRLSIPFTQPLTRLDWLLTILLTAFTSPFTLLDLTELKSRAFSSLWLANGAALSAEMPGDISEILSTVRGVILDVGPGSGEQLHHFNPKQITMAYGAEPTLGLHPLLMRNAEKVGLDGKYKALGCGAEQDSLIPALAKEGLLKSGKADQGVFDEVVCVRVLCGVPRLQETVDGLYKVLKPGGRLVVCEHVVSQAIVPRALQWLYMTIGRWHFLMGGCNMDRDTGKVLRQVAGRDGWKSVSLQRLNDHAAIPYIVGTMVKRQA